MSSLTNTGRSEWGTCKQCRLHDTRRNVVLKRTFRHKSGTSPRLMLLGDAPDKTDDATGIPFIGESGRLLDFILQEVSPFFGVLTHSVCCIPLQLYDEYRPTRDPTSPEINLCKPHIGELIEHYEIQGIVHLGKIHYESRLPKVNLFRLSDILRMEYKYYTIQKQRDALNEFIESFNHRKANNGLHQKNKSLQ